MFRLENRQATLVVVGFLSLPLGTKSPRADPFRLPHTLQCSTKCFTELKQQQLKQQKVLQNWGNDIINIEAGIWRSGTPRESCCSRWQYLMPGSTYCIGFFGETVDNQEQSKKLRRFPLLARITSLIATPDYLITNPITDFLFNSPFLSNGNEG